VVHALGPILLHHPGLGIAERLAQCDEHKCRMFLLEFRLDHHDALLDAEGEARASEVIAYVEGTIHGQGYARIFMPEKFEPQDIVHQTLGLGGTSVTDQGWQIVEEGFAILDPNSPDVPTRPGTASASRTQRCSTRNAGRRASR
jgi:hypothetical protein